MRYACRMEIWLRGYHYIANFAVVFGPELSTEFYDHIETDPPTAMPMPIPNG